MKKIISLGLVVVMIFGLSIMSFADNDSLTELEDYKANERRGNRLSNGFRRSPRKLSKEVIETHAELLSSLIDLDTDEILNNDLRLHELAEDYDVLDELHELLIIEKTEALEALVQEGKITQERADEMLAGMEDRDGRGPRSMRQMPISRRKLN